MTTEAEIVMEALESRLLTEVLVSKTRLREDEVREAVQEIQANVRKGERCSDET